MTHCRFCCEKPRSVWIDGSATFTIAMSRTTMNCTAHRSASASHFVRSEATMSLPCLLSGRHETIAILQNRLSNNKYGLPYSKQGRYTPTVVKSYNQYCPIAHALDVVGERWALLIVRELIEHGQLRYSDLHANLPGCGTNILAARLKDLERHDVVRRRRLPPPAASTIYELTEYGQELRPVLHMLAHWGARSLGPPTADTPLEPGWLAGALEMIFCPTPPDARVEFRVG